MPDKDTKNILLVRPPNTMGRAGEHAMQHPIGLCWLGAALRDAGFAPRIIDYEIEPFDPVALAAEIARLQPLAVGVTAMTPGIESASAIAAAVKNASPRTTTIIGGAHATMFPMRTLEEYPSFDIAAVADGEQRVVEICRAAQAAGGPPQSAIPGCAVRTHDGISDATAATPPPPPLDSLPVPARGLLRLELYRGASTPGIPPGKYRATELFTSRGCPGKCIFCCSENIFGRAVRFRSVSHVMEEITDCIVNFSFNHFTIDDDTFTYQRDRALEFCARMETVSATWDCDTRVDRFDPELARAMACAGCKKVAFGVETGSPEILRLIKKGITIEQVRAAFAAAREAGITTCGFFMVGNHPGETAEDIRLTWSLICEIKPDLISVLLATPYPGTELYDIMRAENLIGEAPWRAYSQSFTAEAFSRTRTLTPEQLKKHQSALLKKFYLRPGYIARRLAIALRDPAELRYWFGAGINFLKYIAINNRKAK